MQVVRRLVQAPREVSFLCSSPAGRRRSLASITLPRGACPMAKPVIKEDSNPASDRDIHGLIGDDVDRDSFGHPCLPVHLRGQYDVDKCDERRRWSERVSNTSLKHIGQWWQKDDQDQVDSGMLRGNAENIIGLAKIPIGLAGPLLLRGEHAQGYVLVPYATVEGTLVAAAARGATAMMRSGGVRVRSSQQSMERGPCFETRSLDEALRLADWLRDHFDFFQKCAQSTSSHARLTAIDTHVFGKSVYAQFCYETGDAAGQNMTTAATWKACHKAMEKLREEKMAVTVERFYLEAKQSRDKGVGQMNLIRTRGTSAHAEVFIPESVLRDTMKVTSDDFLRLWSRAHTGTALSGCAGRNANIVNAVAAIFLATGQDVAAAAESAAAYVTLEKATPEEIVRYQDDCPFSDIPQGSLQPIDKAEGGLYAALTLPTLVIGTVGGGSGLPTQKESLQMMGCHGTGGVKRFAEIIAGSALGLELSTVAALASGQFAAAHENLGRNRPGK